MKSINLIKLILKEELSKILNEALHEIDSDVDLIYDKFFKNDIDKINETGIIKKNQFKLGKFHTSDLKDPLCIKANELNPCPILINSTWRDNAYDPVNILLYLGINKKALDLVISEGGKIENTKNLLPPDQFKRLKQEFSEENIKGVIHHELTHWLDDTLRNNSVKAMVDKRIKQKTINIDGKDAYMHYIEINAMMHNLKQLYKKYNDVWDDLTFSDLFILYPSFSTIYNRLPYKHKIEWTRKIKERMYREGILGNKMKLSQSN